MTCAPWYVLSYPQFTAWNVPVCTNNISGHTCCGWEDLENIEKKFFKAVDNYHYESLELRESCKIALEMALCAPCIGAWVSEH